MPTRDTELVPWCETCDRFYNPNSLHSDGTCPTCGELVAEPEAHDHEGSTGSGAPWHFKLLVGATAVYLGYRLLQGISWVAHHI